MVIPNPSREVRRCEVEEARRHLIPYVKGNNPNYETGWVHEDIASALEQFSRDVTAKLSPRLMIFMPPRHGKSQLASVEFPPWHLGHNPNHEIILGSYNSDIGQGFAEKALNVAQGEWHKEVFPGFEFTNARQKKWFWKLKKGGYMLGTGVGGSATSKGAHIAILDDLVKNWEEAISKAYRDRAWDFYASTIRTRLAAGGGIILIMCMTGDTQVLMADGTEKQIRDIRSGDNIASYDSGRVVTTKVLNWANQGPDEIFTIEMESGISLRANKRHPFLVERNGERIWIQLQELKIGDSLVRVSSVNGVHGAVCSAESKAAESLPNAKGFVIPTTTKSDGMTGLDHHLLTRAPGEMDVCGIDMASGPLNTKRCSQSKMESARSARNHQEKTCVRTGEENSASIIVTNPARLEAYSATTATSLLDTGKKKKSSYQPLSTCAITLDQIKSIFPSGREDVFDIQVEGTENFIANGIVSHNTRWHEDDVAGRLLKQMTDSNAQQWKVIDYPAIAERDEKHRKVGEALHAARYPLKELKLIEQEVGPRVWISLYQQKPRPLGGQYIKASWFKRIQPAELPKGLRFARFWDLAVKAKQANDETASVQIAVISQIPEGGKKPLEYIYARMMYAWKKEWPDSKKEIVAISSAEKVPVGIEANSAFEIAVQEIRADLKGKALVQGLVMSTDKLTRALPWMDIAEAGRFILVEEGNWIPPFLSEAEGWNPLEADQQDNRIDAVSGGYMMTGGRKLPGIR